MYAFSRVFLFPVVSTVVLTIFGMRRVTRSRYQKRGGTGMRGVHVACEQRCKAQCRSRAHVTGTLHRASAVLPKATATPSERTSTVKESPALACL